MASVIDDLAAVNRQLQADDLAALRSISHAVGDTLENAGEAVARLLVARMQGRIGPADALTTFRRSILKFSDIVARGMAFGDLVSRLRLVRGLEDIEPQFKKKRGPVYQSLNEQLPNFLSLPFEEAVEDMASREPVLENEATKIAEAYQKQKFVVAQSTSIAFTAQVQKSITAALRQGVSMADTVKLFRDRGLSDAYAENVFRTNLKTSMMAGRMDMANDPDVSEFIVAWSYQTAGDSDVRPNHAKMNNFKASRKSPIWDVWTPPAGYQCRCSLIEVTRDEAENLGRIKAGRFSDSKPRGVLPDPGFGRNPRKRIYS